MKNKKRNFTHSRYGLKSGLILLIPIFPIFTLLPMVGLADALGKYFPNCGTGYRITYLSFLILAIMIDFLYSYRAVRKDIAEKDGFGLSFLFNLFLYSLINSFVFVAVVGTDGACCGDGQVALYAIFSGPISSFVVFLNGLIIDVIKYMLKNNRTKQKA